MSQDQPEERDRTNTHCHCEFYTSRFSPTGWVPRGSVTNNCWGRGRGLGVKAGGEGNSNSVSACDERSPSLKGTCLCCCPGSRVPTVTSGLLLMRDKVVLSRGRGWQRAHRGAVGENALSPSPPAPGPAGLGAAPARCRQAGGSEGKWRGASALLCPGHPYPRGSSSSLCGTASLWCSRGDKAARDRILKDSESPATESSPGAVLPQTPEAKSGRVVSEISLSRCDMAAVGGTGSEGSAPPVPRRDTQGWAGHTGAGQSLTQSGLLLPTDDCHSPHTQQGCSRGTRATRRCSTQPTAQLRGAAEQLFPAVVMGLGVTRCILTSSCALAKALYPQAKTSTLAISRSNTTATILTFTQFCCCCCCSYEHRSSIQLSWFSPKLATGARGNLWHMSRVCFSKGAGLPQSHWFWALGVQPLWQSPRLPPWPPLAIRAQHSLQASAEILWPTQRMKHRTTNCWQEHEEDLYPVTLRTSRRFGKTGYRQIKQHFIAYNTDAHWHWQLLYVFFVNKETIKPT